MKQFVVILILAAAWPTNAGIGRDDDFEHERNCTHPPLPEVSTWAAGVALVSMVVYAAWKRGKK